MFICTGHVHQLFREDDGKFLHEKGAPVSFEYDVFHVALPIGKRSGDNEIRIARYHSP